MNCIYSVSSAFTYSEFQRAKINGVWKKSFRKFLPLSVRTFAGEKSTVWKTPFTYLEFQRGEIQPFSKIFLRSLITGLGEVRFGWFFKKFCPLLSSTAQKSKMPNIGQKFSGIKMRPRFFKKRERRTSAVFGCRRRAKLPTIQVGNIFWTFFVSLDFIRICEYNV